MHSFSIILPLLVLVWWSQVIKHINELIILIVPIYQGLFFFISIHVQMYVFLNHVIKIRSQMYFCCYTGFLENWVPLFECWTRPRRMLKLSVRWTWQCQSSRMQPLPLQCDLFTGHPLRKTSTMSKSTKGQQYIKFLHSCSMLQLCQLCASWYFICKQENFFAALWWFANPTHYYSCCKIVFMLSW